MAKLKCCRCKEFDATWGNVCLLCAIALSNEAMKEMK